MALAIYTEEAKTGVVKEMVAKQNLQNTVGNEITLIYRLPLHPSTEFSAIFYWKLNSNVNNLLLFGYCIKTVVKNYLSPMKIIVKHVSINLSPVSQSPIKKTCQISYKQNLKNSNYDIFNLFSFNIPQEILLFFNWNKINKGW